MRWFWMKIVTGRIGIEPTKTAGPWRIPDLAIPKIVRWSCISNSVSETPSLICLPVCLSAFTLALPAWLPPVCLTAYCLTVSLSVCLPVYLPDHMHAYVTVIWQSDCLTNWLSHCSAVWLSGCLIVWLSDCLTFTLSICLSVHLQYFRARLRFIC